MITKITITNDDGTTTDVWSVVSEPVEPTTVSTEGSEATPAPEENAAPADEAPAAAEEPEAAPEVVEPEVVSEELHEQAG